MGCYADAQAVALQDLVEGRMDRLNVLQSMVLSSS